MTQIETDFYDVCVDCLPRIVDALERIANLMEKKGKEND